MPLAPQKHIGHGSVQSVERQAVRGAAIDSMARSERDAVGTQSEGASQGREKSHEAVNATGMAKEGNRAAMHKVFYLIIPR